MPPPSGFTLIEILISLFLFSLLILGVQAMQLYTFRQMESVYYFNIAMEQLHSLSEHLQVTKGTQREELERAWNVQNKQILPNGIGFIEGVAPHLNINIFWGKTTNYHCNQTTLGQSGCLKSSITLMAQR